MAIPTHFDSADDAPEFLRDHLVERDGGKFAVEMLIPGGQKIGNVAGVVASLETIKAEKDAEATKRREYEEKLKPYEVEEGRYIDAQQARDAIDKLTSGKFKDSDELKAAEQAIEARLNESYAGRLSERDEQIVTMSGQLQSMMVDAVALKALSQTNCANSNLLMPHIRDMVKVVDDGKGGLKAQVMKADGTPRVSLREGQEGQDMSVEELCQDLLKDQFPEVFPSKAQSAAPGARSGQRGKTRLRDTMKGNSLFQAARRKELGVSDA
ncbi:MAG: hypothetical protein AAF196_17035 [Planctomycetota bacterium]